MPYPSRPVHAVLSEFVDTAGTRSQTPAQRARLRAFVAAEYQCGRSLRELAELTGRTRTAVRRALDEAGVPRRGRITEVDVDWYMILHAVRHAVSQLPHDVDELVHELSHLNTWSVSPRGPEQAPADDQPGSGWNRDQSTRCA